MQGSTEPDMREKGKTYSRSGGHVDRRVIVHRSADRGAVRARPFSIIALAAPGLLPAVNSVSGERRRELRFI